MVGSMCLWNFKPWGNSFGVIIKTYLKQAGVFFLLSVANNVALNYKISMPLHMIFRSSSLVATLLLGRFFYGKRYVL